LHLQHTIGKTPEIPAASISKGTAQELEAIAKEKQSSMSEEEQFRTLLPSIVSKPVPALPPSPQGQESPVAVQQKPASAAKLTADTLTTVMPRGEKVTAADLGVTPQPVQPVKAKPLSPIAVKKPQPRKQPEQTPISQRPATDRHPSQSRVAAVKPLVVPSTAVADTFTLQLGSFRSEQLARSAWNQVVGKHNRLLGMANPHVRKAEIPGKGTFYRLQAGSFNRAEADAACNMLRRGSEQCMVVRR
jgi:hypothetical protein